MSKSISRSRLNTSDPTTWAKSWLVDSLMSIHLYDDPEEFVADQYGGSLPWDVPTGEQVAREIENNVLWPLYLERVTKKWPEVEEWVWRPTEDHPDCK
jgi:hypothetical protein